MPADKRSLTGALGALFGFVCLSAIAGLIVTAAVTPAVAVTGVATNNTISAFDQLPESLKLDQLSQVTKIYAHDGNAEREIASFYVQNRVEVGWNDISQYVKDAATSGEDPEFYHHGAISVKGTMRAAVSTFLHHDTQGGSTITQQYVKNVLIQECEADNADNTAKLAACYQNATRQTISRKIQEMKYAIGLEKKYTKRQILLGYLNINGFGGQVYGIQSAAEYYFGVSAKDLSLPQAASLVAIVQNPDYNRLDRPKNDKINGADNGYQKNKARRDYILAQMLKYNKITQAQYEKAVQTPVKPKITPQSNGCMAANAYDAGAFCNYIENLIKNDPAFGATSAARFANLRRGGYKIYTTLDLGLQKKAQETLSGYVPAYRAGMDLGAASVGLQQNTGNILYMVQNRSFNDTPSAAKHHQTSLNYAVDKQYGGSQGFQTGSTYKAFDLIAWLEEGHTLNTVVDASRHLYPQSMFHSSCDTIAGADWNVGNAEGSAGHISVLNATKYSVNTAFARMATQTDLCQIKKSAQALGVHLGDGQPIQSVNPSAVIGTQDIAPLTMAVAYAAIANNGIVCTPIAIDKIVDGSGANVPTSKTTCTQGIDPAIANAAAYALQTPLTPGGTAATANPHDGVPMLAKTGTTDYAAQNWLISATTKTAQATWVGNVEAVASSGGTPHYADMRTEFFRGIDGATRAGNNVKFPIVKAITAMLNKRFGGTAFPKIEAKYLNGAQTAVPDVGGMTASAATTALEKAGFTVATGAAVDGVQPAGTVEKTSPAAGAKAPKGSTVTIYASKGNEKTLPDAGQVIGQTLAQAT
ncbi:MAG TPA: transglycosylase domain-containing protein, partial [Microbacteriaceae bacterium]|nr:transglycosylase domain-containing protein [Microbacteriaceae bacterium]